MSTIFCSRLLEGEAGEEEAAEDDEEEALGEIFETFRINRPPARAIMVWVTTPDRI
jgi:hypothetical protein